jgi:hypothetical protein
MMLSPCKTHRSGSSVTCWKKVSIASRSTVRRAPSAASDLPLVRISSKTEPQAPRDALSKISKSKASFDSLPWNQDHLSCPIASEIGSISAPDAILDRTVVIVRPAGHFPRDWSFKTASIAIIAPNQEVSFPQCIVWMSLILTHTHSTCCDAENLEHPTFNNVLRSIVTCEFTFQTLWKIQGGFLADGSLIGWRRCSVLAINV